MLLKRAALVLLFVFLYAQARASYIIVPMDGAQQNHLRPMAWPTGHWSARPR